MEEGEEVFIPEDIKTEVLNRMYNSIQHRSQLRDTCVIPADLPDVFMDSPSLPEQRPVSSSHSSNTNQNTTPTPSPTIPTSNETDNLPLTDLPSEVASQVVEAASIEELLQRGANMAELPTPPAYRPAVRPAGVAANAEDLESFLLHQARMRSE